MNQWIRLMPVLVALAFVCSSCGVVAGSPRERPQTCTAFEQWGEMGELNQDDDYLSTPAEFVGYLQDLLPILTQISEFHPSERVAHSAREVHARVESFLAMVATGGPEVSDEIGELWSLLSALGDEEAVLRSAAMDCGVSI